MKKKDEDQLRERFERLYCYKYIDLTFKDGKYRDSNIQKLWDEYKDFHNN